ncbi:DUF3050 domain-containing protein [Sphingomonas sp. NCPPB 2930]
MHPPVIDQKLALLQAHVLQMKTHAVFAKVRTKEDLRTFMRWHVFAVWDFMSLVKRLQNELTCTSLPWTPPKAPLSARLINEIVLGEESDEYPGHGHASHFDLYLAAMREVGAPTATIETFVGEIRSGTPVAVALQRVDAPAPVRAFVEATLRVALHGSLAEVAGNFCFGREDLVPQMFQGLLDQWQMSRTDCPLLAYYLDRHIQLDSGEHGPAAQEMMRSLLGEDLDAWLSMIDAANEAIAQRTRLWDALAAEIETVNHTASQPAMVVQASIPLSGQACRSTSVPVRS